MNEFLIVSGDVHDDDQAFEKLSSIASLPSCLAFLYSGDLNIDNYFISTAVRNRNYLYLPVLGNTENQWAYKSQDIQVPPLFRTCNFKGLRIFISHGHLYYDPESAGLNTDDFDLIITGHSHQHSLFEEKGVFYLNPGSPSRPRGYCSASYSLIEFFETSVLVKLTSFRDDKIIGQIEIPLKKTSNRN